MAVGWLGILCAGFIARGEDVVMPKGYAKEFTRDVVAVARRGDSVALEVAMGCTKDLGQVLS